MNRHCGHCRNPWIDNPDCACPCHESERLNLVTLFATTARNDFKPTNAGHRPTKDRTL